MADSEYIDIEDFEELGASSKEESKALVLKRDASQSIVEMFRETKTERLLLWLAVLGTLGAVAFLIYRSMRQPISGLAGYSGGFPFGFGPVNGPSFGYPGFQPPYQQPAPIQIFNYSPASNAPLALPAPNARSDMGNNTNGTPVRGYAKTDVSDVDDESGTSLGTRLFSTNLFNSQPTRLFTAAGGKFWRVELRAVNPPGGFALVSTDPVALQNTNILNQEAIVIPVGGYNTVHLRPGQTLYGRSGNVANVSLSVAASVERT